jgi:Tfp pilus assembly protein PilX
MPRRAPSSPRRGQRGVVLFIALIAMVVLSLAGVALIRAVDTSGSAAGNIAFREASVTAVNLAVEQAVNWLYVSKTLNPETDVDVAHHYYGKLQPGELPNGLPAELGGTYATMKAA